MDRAAALKTERAEVVSFLHDLDPADWAKPSRCAGWTIQDVVAHLGAAAHGTFTPWVLGLMRSKDVEAGNDQDAKKRAEWAPEKVLKEYERWSRRLCRVQGTLQAPGMRSLPIRVAEVGTYPAKLLTSAFVFDTGLHLRHDMAGALGREVPARDANALAVTIEWMLAGLPVMTGEALTWLDKEVEVNLVGPGGGTWTVAPGGKKGRVSVRPVAAESPSAIVEGDAATFPEWGTGRLAWRDADVSIKGDEELGTRFLDSMRII